MGIFFKDYESAGPGIAKDAPKKKGAALYFELFGRKFWQIIGLNMIYYVFFIPLVLAFVLLLYKGSTNLQAALICVCIAVFAVLIGPATAGLVKVLKNYILEKHSFMFKDFFGAFRDNFKRAALVGILDCVILASCMASLSVYPQLAVVYDTRLMYVPMVITLSLGLMVLMMNYYVFLLIVGTDLTMKNIIKDSFFLAIIGLKRNLLSTVIVIVSAIIMTLMMLYIPSLFLLLITFIPMSIVWFTICFISYPMIQKHILQPYYEMIGEENPETAEESRTDEETIFVDMGGKEAPIEKRKKGKGKRIS